MPATKHDYGDSLGTLTQGNFKFLAKLWARNSSFRQDLFTMPDGDLRGLLKAEYGIEVAEDVKIVLVDIENVKMKTVGLEPPQQVNPREKFYALVLPPRPRAHQDNLQYQTMQGWNAAHYHAVNDSYGM